jgi:OmcA/MtrC family decaheme c-type cytochrome
MRFAAHAASLAVISSLCNEPRIGPAVSGPVQPAGPAVVVLATDFDPAGAVTVTYALTLDGAPVSGEAAAALAPAFTLAALEADPGSEGASWRSLVANGGAEWAGPTVDHGDGTFTYTFAQPLGDVADGTTVRGGLFLRGAANDATTVTFDLVRGGGTPPPADLVDATACAGCHGVVRGHDGTRSGTAICVTCHTSDLADADTVDPAAPLAATRAERPNPLEFGTLAHRIHRGKRLPTLYVASSADAAPPLPPPDGTALPVPFSPTRNAPLLGQAYRVVGADGRDRVFGRAVSRSENGLPPRTLATGVTYPQDGRHCATCHATAAQLATVHETISRRACTSCHPDVWFETATPPDAVHLAHPGGPQADDLACAGCHVTSTATPEPLAPIDAIHVAPFLSPRANRPVLKIVSVTGMTPGASPTIVFELSDEVGSLDHLAAPSIQNDTGATPSPVRRGIGYANVTVAGANPDFGGLYGGAVPLSEPLPNTLAADASGRFTYTLKGKLPVDAKGTWAIALDAMRSATVPHYDAATNRFQWPYTGEAVLEAADAVVAWVDVADGTLAGGAPVPRRAIVNTESCERCHLRFALHGGGRNALAQCVMCHTPETSDWIRRPKAADGNVDLSKTIDGLEERTAHFKVLIHRIHTGARTGLAALDHSRPFAITGYYGVVYFFDEGEFSGDLSDCRNCHDDGTYRIEAIPREAAPTRANETSTIRHDALLTHGDGDPVTPPIQAACGGCHGTGASLGHFARYTTADRRESCLGCHGDGRTLPVGEVHAIRAR